MGSEEEERLLLREEGSLPPGFPSALSSPMSVPHPSGSEVRVAGNPP